MTTLTDAEVRTTETGDFNDHPMIAADIIYKGAAVGDNGSGYMRPLVAGDPFRGFAEHTFDNSSGTAGAINARMQYVGVIRLSVVGASALTDKGANVYASDDNTFTLTKGANSFIGKVYRWDTSTYCYVFFDVEGLSEDSAAITTLNYPKTVPATEATAGNATYTTAQLLGGLILRDPAGGARTDTTPTAAQLVAAISNPIVGTSFEFTIRNTADAAETITVAGGTGVTTSGTMTIAQNNSKRFLARLDNVTASSEAVTLYSLGTVVH
jgi:hypothetical protein